MTWVQEYRESLNMDREEFAAAITHELGGSGGERVVIPAKLIYMLEAWPKCYTHPNLINLIARA